MPYTPEQVEALNEAGRKFQQTYRTEINSTNVTLDAVGPYGNKEEPYYSQIDRAVEAYRMSKSGAASGSRATVKGKAEYKPRKTW